MKHLSRIALTVIMIIIIISAGTGCAQSTDGSSDKKMVAVSIVPQETFVKAVAGELIEVVALIPPGSSPESYSPTPRDLQKFSQASIYFSIGVPTEAANIIPKIKDLAPNTKIVNLANIVAQKYPDREFSPGERDPHIWLSPKRVKVMVDAIESELSILDPANSSVYKQNAEAYKSRLDKLDKDIKETLKDLPDRTFIAYHPAFGYFADDYGLQIITLEEEGKEAAPQDFQKVIETAKSEGIKVIFYQAEVDSRQSKALAEEIGGRTEQISPLAPNYIENLEKIADTFAEVLRD